MRLPRIMVHLDQTCLTQGLDGGNLIPTSALHNCTQKAILGISTAACKPRAVIRVNALLFWNISITIGPFWD